MAKEAQYLAGLTYEAQQIFDACKANFAAATRQSFDNIEYINYKGFAKYKLKSNVEARDLVKSTYARVCEGDITAQQTLEALVKDFIKESGTSTFRDLLISISNYTLYAARVILHLQQYKETIHPVEFSELKRRISDLITAFDKLEKFEERADFFSLQILTMLYQKTRWNIIQAHLENLSEAIKEDGTKSYYPAK